MNAALSTLRNGSKPNNRDKTPDKCPIWGIAAAVNSTDLSKVKLALVGNPNTGKSTLFQRLTGKAVTVGNLAGVTMETAVAPCKFKGGEHWVVHDFPGLYNLHAQSEDGQITERSLLDPGHPHRPDVVLLVADVNALQGQLFLILQIRELGIPCVVLLNHMHPAGPSRSDLDKQANHLERALDVPVMVVNAHQDNPKDWVARWTPLFELPKACAAIRAVPAAMEAGVKALRPHLPTSTPGLLCHLLRMQSVPSWLSAEGQKAWHEARQSLDSPSTMQLQEAGERMAQIREILPSPQSSVTPSTTRLLDHVFTHPLWGVLGFGLIFFIIFQAVYSWATVPTDLLDGWMASGIDAVKAIMPNSWWRSLLVDGVLAGLSGILVFLPQILILFGFTALLEHSGAMARLGYVGDRFLQRLGLGGRSAVSLVGGMACAIPAVMAARAIPDRRERLLTILVTPMMTCSARLPVYAFLIAFVVPEGTWGGFNKQGLFLYGLYLVSTLATLIMAWVLHRTLPHNPDRRERAEEWPPYRLPKLSLVVGNMLRQGAIFLRSAGKVILMLSVVLWGLGFIGKGSLAERQSMDPAKRLETSVLGSVGKAMEPIVTPLGFDGRMGMAVLSSFAAREVFVGTVQTLYPASDASTPKVSELKSRLARETHPRTGRPLLTTASAASLIVFYMFAMQCLSTIAIVRSELKSWRWAVGQAVGLTGLAYLFAWMTHVILS